MRRLLLLLLMGCSGETINTPPGPPHVVLITLDTTRADRLGAYGYEGAQTETLDALANGGLRFDRAYSPAPLTIPAHISLFTGLYPPNHGVRSNGDGVLREDHYTLTRALAEQGYRTGGSVSAFVTTRKWGFHHDFDAFYDAVPQEKNAWRGERPAVEVVDDALGWVTESGFEQPLYLWLHLYDAHFPLQAPAAYVERLEGRPYDAEIAYVDDQVARVVKAFEGQPTLFVVAGDHGEGLGDHGELGHGLFVYDSTQRVPLFISGPGVTPGVVESPVSLVDVMPTVLKTLGHAVPEGIDGRPAPHDEPVYMEAFMLQDRLGLAPHIGLVKANHKLIDVPRPELYNLSSDPGELADQASKEMSQLVVMKQTLDGLGFAARDSSAAIPLDPEVAMQLEALGYVQPSGPAEPDVVLEDAKDHQDLIRWTQQSERYLKKGEFEKADVLLNKLTEKYPKLVKAKSSRIMALSHLGRVDEALALAREVRAEHPDNANVAALLAGLLGRTGKLEEAAALYREAAEGMPWASHLRVQGVMTSSRVKGSEGEALALAEQYLKEDPENPMLSGFVGLHYLSIRRVEEALPLLEKAAKADQPLPMVCFHLGAKAHQDGRLDDSKRYLLREVTLHPKNAMAFRLLKDVYVAEEDWAGMVALAQRGLEMGPSSEYSRMKAQGLFNQKKWVESRRVLDVAMKRFPKDSNLALLDANLLMKEGKEAEAKARFESAKKLHGQKKGR